MSDNNDDTQNYALMAVAGVIVLVIAGVLTLAINATRGGHEPKAAPAPVSASSPAAAEGAASEPVQAADAASGATADAAAPTARLYFELGADALPADAAEAITRVAEAAAANPAASVLISGYHDATGDADKNAELAKNRALIVRGALEVKGIAADRLVMAKPAVTEGGTDAREARRVDVLVH
ncbi:hypothetical protein BH11PSE8_BH11PSE8_03990 [soil metagenome]